MTYNSIVAAAACQRWRALTVMGTGTESLPEHYDPVQSHALELRLQVQSRNLEWRWRPCSTGLVCIGMYCFWFVLRVLIWVCIVLTLDKCKYWRAFVCIV